MKAGCPGACLLALIALVAGATAAQLQRDTAGLRADSGGEPAGALDARREATARAGGSGNGSVPSKLPTQPLQYEHETMTRAICRPEAFAARSLTRLHACPAQRLRPTCCTKDLCHSYEYLPACLQI